MVKLPYAPESDPGALPEPEVKVLPVGSVLYRVYPRGGKHPSGWASMRTFGPLPGSRFDPHPGLPEGGAPGRDPLPAECAPVGVLYAARAEGAEGIVTALAEVFQNTRAVDRCTNEPWLCAFALEADLDLLDLSGKWPTRAGASANISSGPKNRARSWSRVVYRAYPRLLGLYYPSSMNPPHAAVALFERAARSLPARPSLNTPLSNPDLYERLAYVSEELNYRLPR